MQIGNTGNISTTHVYIDDTLIQNEQGQEINTQITTKVGEHAASEKNKTLHHRSVISLGNPLTTEQLKNSFGLLDPTISRNQAEARNNGYVCLNQAEEDSTLFHLTVCDHLSEADAAVTQAFMACFVPGFNVRENTSTDDLVASNLIEMSERNAEQKYETHYIDPQSGTHIHFFS